MINQRSCQSSSGWLPGSEEVFSPGLMGDFKDGIRDSVTVKSGAPFDLSASSMAREQKSSKSPGIKKVGDSRNRELLVGDLVNQVKPLSLQ